LTKNGADNPDFQKKANWTNEPSKTFPKNHASSQRLKYLNTLSITQNQTPQKTQSKSQVNQSVALSLNTNSFNQVQG
jgi:hypothetical protein